MLKEGEKEKIERDKALKRMRSQQDLHHGPILTPGAINGAHENGSNDFERNGLGGGRVGAGWNRREGSSQSQSNAYGGNSYQSQQQLQHSSLYNNIPQQTSAPRHFQYQSLQPTSQYQHQHHEPAYPSAVHNNGAAGEEDDYGQLVNGPYSGTFNSFPGALEIGSRPVEDGFELLGANEDQIEVGSAGSSANAIDPRYGSSFVLVVYYTANLVALSRRTRPQRYSNARNLFQMSHLQGRFVT